MAYLYFANQSLVFAQTAGIYYVSPTGSASWANSININTPTSWQTSMANAVAGDIVYFRGGTYNVGTIGSQRDYANMRPTNSGTAGNPITFIAYPSETPTITGTVVAGTSTAAYFGCSYVNYITWDGFSATLQRYGNDSGDHDETQTWAAWYSNYCSIKNSNFTGIDVGGWNYNTAFVRIEGSNYATIENNYFHDLIGGATAINSAATYVFNGNNTTIINNSLNNMRGGFYIKFGAQTATISNNFIGSCSGTNSQGMFIQNEPGFTNSNVFIFRNIIIGCDTGIYILGSSPATVDNVKVYNNTVYGGRFGIATNAMIVGGEVYNNIIMNASTHQLRYYSASLPLYSNYNNFYTVSGTLVWDLSYTADYSTIASWRTATGFDANSITTNPLFVNAGGANPADYKLQFGSPALTSGRGGSYASVMGAYITGDEVIGYSSGGVSTADTAAPSVPTGLSATAVSSSQINLSWTASTDNVGVTGYRIYRNGIQIATATATTYSDTGLTASTAYTYTVSAYDAAGNVSAQSVSANATTQAVSVNPTILFQEDFEDANFSSRSWYDGTTLKLSTAEHYSGNSSVEYHFLQGATTPEISGGAIRKLFTATNEVYVSYWVKYSANYTGSNRPYHPHEFLMLTTENSAYQGPSVSHLTAYIEQNEGTPMLSLQDSQNIDNIRVNQDLTNITENRGVSGCNGVPAIENPFFVDCYLSGSSYRNAREWKAGQIYFQDTTGPYYKNNWHRVEAYFKLNSIANSKGQSDGIIRYWYDGNLLIERNNIILRTAQYPNMGFNQFLMAPYIGDGSPVDQTMWVDNLVVATSRPSQDTISPSAPSGLVVD